eukprot:GHVR01185573.1.p1 GENE.GHVR01185573.1~~GHVR01185573.1.p1  ORF type:complete len:122 (-),score=14.53 GHVR01185573.1:1051-1416(-)
MLKAFSLINILLLVTIYGETKYKLIKSAGFEHYYIAENTVNDEDKVYIQVYGNCTYDPDGMISKYMKPDKYNTNEYIAEVLYDGLCSATLQYDDFTTKNKISNFVFCLVSKYYIYIILYII